MAPMYFTQNKTSYNQQRGATLIVALIILLLVTILGISSIRTATVEERMAASTRDKDIALQAAEAALVSAETYLATLANAAAFNDSCSNGLCTPLASLANGERWENEALCSGKGIWDCGSQAVASTVFSDTGTVYAKPPRYFIELLTEYEPQGDNINAYNYGSEITNTQITVFRITALGYGGTEDAKVVLQSTFARKF